MVTGVPILTFHALDEAGPPLAYPPRRFGVALAALARAGWRGVPLLDLVAALDDPRPLPARRFAVTFDDGYRSVYDVAFPELARHSVPATVFVSLGVEPPAAGGRLAPMEGRERLSWAEMREMAAHGVEFGSHTFGHPDLTRLGPSELEREVRDSRRALEDALGRPVRSFAYPFGRFDRPSRDLAASVYEAAVSDRLGLARRRDDRHALPRVDTYYLRGERALLTLTKGRLAVYLALRNAPRRLRRALGMRARSALASGAGTAGIRI